MINVLVTGSNGQLGRCLRDIANTNEKIKWRFKSSKELDITNKNTVNSLFGNTKFDYLGSFQSIFKVGSENIIPCSDSLL